MRRLRIRRWLVSCSTRGLRARGEPMTTATLNARRGLPTSSCLGLACSTPQDKARKRHRFLRTAVIVLGVVLSGPGGARADGLAYQTPSRPIADLVDAPPTPNASVSPDR